MEIKMVGKHQAVLVAIAMVTTPLVLGPSALADHQMNPEDCSEGDELFISVWYEDPDETGVNGEAECADFIRAACSDADASKCDDASGDTASADSTTTCALLGGDHARCTTSGDGDGNDLIDTDAESPTSGPQVLQAPLDVSATFNAELTRASQATAAGSVGTWIHVSAVDGLAFKCSQGHCSFVDVDCGLAERCEVT